MGKKLKRSNDLDLDSCRMTLTYVKLPEGCHVCINYESSLLGHVGAVAKAGGGDGQ